MFETAERFVDSSGSRIRFIEAGTGPPLLLLHGLGQSSTAWRRVMPAFAASRHTIAVDFPGFGASPAPDALPYGGPEYFARVLDGFARSQSLDSIDAIGHSGGGLALLIDAMRHDGRYRKLVVVDPAGFTPTPDNLLGTAAASLARLLVSVPRNRAITRALYSTAFFDAKQLDEETVDELHRRHQDPSAKRVARRAYSKYIDYCRNLDNFHTQAASLKAPVLAIWGRDDRLFRASDAASLQRVIPHARIDVFEQCGHCPQIEQPGRFAAVVEEFLTGP